MDRRHRAVDIQAEVFSPNRRDPPRLSAVGDDRVHRIGRHEADRAAARTAERLQQLLQDFVGSVCCPDVLDADLHAGRPGQIVGQIAPQVDGVAIGIAMQFGGRGTHRLGGVVDKGGTRRVRVLVGVQSHRHFELRRAVGGFAAQVIPQRQVVQTHPFAENHGCPLVAHAPIIARTSDGPPRRGRAGPRRWPG